MAQWQGVEREGVSELKASNVSSLGSVASDVSHFGRQNTKSPQPGSRRAVTEN